MNFIVEIDYRISLLYFGVKYVINIKMAKKADTFQQKISRNDRFAQMSQQEKIIEQKKKEILAKLEAKEVASKAELAKSKSDSSKTGLKR